VSRLSRTWRIVLASVAAFVVLVLVGGSTFTVWTVRRSFPQVTGSVTLRGLAGDVHVYRDEWGVPQILAGDALDLFRAQGYVHAQDRFWEMDFRRHVTSGRLSELFGSDQVETDTFIRTLGWRRVAQQELAILRPDTRRYLQAYADGVNAYLSTHSGAQLSLEYAVLGLKVRGYRPEKWTPADSVAWLKAMAWDLRSNLDEETDRAELLQTLTASQVDDLYPAYPYAQHPPITQTGTTTTPVQASAVPRPRLPRGALAAVRAVRAAARGLPDLIGPAGSGIGSNAWAVSGAHTTTGEPLLANDPHLAPHLPSIWTQMGLHCAEVTATCPFDVAGFTFSGLPGVVIGHNSRVAWGFTNLAPDVADLYLEKVAGDTYEYQGEQLPLTTRHESITVAGEDKPRDVIVRSTRHGPLLSDASDRYADIGHSYAVALQWTALTPGRTADAVFLVDRARDWREFRAAAASFEVPAQNMVYADTAGHIGYQSPGRIPIRSRGDGSVPVPGWTGTYEWTGYIPFAKLPSVYDPPSGYVVTANQAVTPPTYPYLLTTDWDYGYRSTRILQRLQQSARLDVAAMSRIQLDNRNPVAAAVVPLLLREHVDTFTSEAQRLLRGWDFGQGEDSAPAAYFNAVWRHLLARTFDDQLPEDLEADGGDRWMEVVTELLQRPDDPWWDDVTTKNVRESRDLVLHEALVDARLDLTSRLGKDPTTWRWGRLHELTLENETFGTSGVGVVESLFNRGPVDVAGGNAAVDATGWTSSSDYQTDWVPSMRMVVDLADLDRSRWVNLAGASGHAYDTHYWDQTELWRTGRTTPWRWGTARIRRAAEHTLVLRP
jgi:penicillin G amidase